LPYAGAAVPAGAAATSPWQAVAGRTVTRLLWKVLWPARSASASDVVQLMLRPSVERLAQRPLGETATPGRTFAVTVARKVHQPRALSTITSSPSVMPRATASLGLISIKGVPSFASRLDWFAMLLVTKWCEAPEISTNFASWPASLSASSA